MAFTGFIAGGTNLPSSRDTFTRADQTGPGGNWTGPLFTGEGSLDIVSNTLHSALGDGHTVGGVYYNSDESFTDEAACMTLVTMTATANANTSMWTRIPAAILPMGSPASSWDFYRVTATRVSGANNDTLTADEVVDGTFTTMTPSSGSTTFGADWGSNDLVGYTIRETGGQTEIVTWRLASGGTWTLIGTYLSSTAGRQTSAGRIAIEINDNDFSDTGAIDDLCVEEYVPTPPGAQNQLAWIRA